jgi:signal transduction histidine kinase
VLVGVVVVFTDITRYREIDEIKSQFVATVAHEFRTPLGAVKIPLPSFRSPRQVALAFRSIIPPPN